MADWKNAVVRVYKGEEYRGSAFMVSDRWLLTCEHVVRGAKAEEILLCDATAWRGGVRQVKEIYCNQKIEVALLELKEPTAKADVVPVCTEPVDFVGTELECSGFSGETGDRDTLRMPCRRFEGLWNLLVLQGKAGKGMSGSPAMHQGRLVGILRLQDDNTYVVPVKDFEELLQEHHVPFNEQVFANSSPSDSDGTKIPQDEFDSVIKKHLKELFDDSSFKDVEKKIFELARKAPGSMGIEDLLCSPEVAIEDAIGWLTQAVERVLKKLPAEEKTKFKDNAKSVLGWLVLRTVKSDWLETNGPLFDEQWVELSIGMLAPFCLEIVIARKFERKARFEKKEDIEKEEDTLRGEWDLGEFKTEPGIEPDEALQELFQLIWMQLGLPKREGRARATAEEEKKLRDKLHAYDCMFEQRYLTIPLDGLSAPLQREDLVAFHHKFPKLKLILLYSEDVRPMHEQMLWVDEKILDEQLLAFFRKIENV